MKRLYAAKNLIQAHSVKNFLSTFGIESSLQGEALAGAVGELPMNLVEIEIFVSNDKYAEADALLEKFLSDMERPLEYWQCSHCGEKNATSYEFCWQCQAEPENV